MTDEQEEEIEINDENFEEYFHDVRRHAPQRGEIIARYAASAEFITGIMKRDIIDLVYRKNKAEAAVQVMRKLGCAAERDAIRVCREIAEDLMGGMTETQVEQKAYRYTVELFYWTKKECVPTDDPHWSIISISNLDDFLDAADNKLKMTSKVLPPEQREDDPHDFAE